MALCSYILTNQEIESWDTIIVWISPFAFLWDGATHIQGISSLLQFILPENALMNIAKCVPH